VNSPQEAQLVRDLRQLASDQPFTPDLEVIGLRARRRYRRGLALRGATVGGAAVLAAGGLFVAVGGTGGTAGGTGGTAAGQSAGTTAGPRVASARPTGAVSAAPRPETEAYVTKQVTTALADVNDYVVRTDQTQTGPGGDSATNWMDPRTGNDYEILHDSTTGTSIAWLSTYLVNRVLTWKTIEADYSTRTWFVSVMHAAGPIQGSTAGATNSVLTPAQIKAWLDSGTFTIVGHQDINGHHAIGLRGPWADGYRELWVDSQTFLPVRFIMADFANTNGPLKNVMLVGNETWLPRANSLLDTVNHVHIPAGFRQVAPPQ
jgi:hypothetical protein